MFEAHKNKCDDELVFYCNHVVSELREFYEYEYYMFELLASGQLLDFKEAEDKHIRHLVNYGIVGRKDGDYAVTIPVVGKYVGIELAKSEGRSLVYKIVEKPGRETWLTRRKEEIVTDLRVLEKITKKNSSPLIYGPASFPEADEFLKITVADSLADFSVFINTCYRCFVEPIDHYGKSINIKTYFGNVIKREYPKLFDALLRIRVYRNERDHIQLNNIANEQFLAFRKADLEGRSPSQISDLYFTLQQRVLDALLLSIQSEITRLS
ncbi:MAG: hypothetical protein H6666_03385 [Ardenticatenaceae bacterium]|nr:hypothetical protein [Ardenticatenaceae bacterium]